jgi:parallel beta-helix repeat protein
VLEDGADDNLLKRNKALDSADDGIDLQEGAEDNVVKRNKASGNGTGPIEDSFDLEDDNLDCDNNTWKKNKGEKSQDCVN